MHHANLLTAETKGGILRDKSTGKWNHGFNEEVWRHGGRPRHARPPAGGDGLPAPAELQLSATPRALLPAI